MEESDWPAVSALIGREWETNHPVLDKDFFLWQHRGFGEIAGVGSTPLAFVADRLVGMRGLIPGVYQVPRTDNGYEHVLGGSFAMWIVEKESRGAGIGRELLRYCEEHLGVMVALGSNEATSVPIYMKNGFSRQDALHHWFRVLDSRGTQLIYGLEPRQKIFGHLDEGRNEAVVEIDNPDIPAEIWSKFSARNRVFGLLRNSDFWEWRYFTHPTFNYRVVVDEKFTTLAVTRVEEVTMQGEEIKVLRIIELFSVSAGVKNISGARSISRFLKSLLKEASDSGISAADHRCSTNVMGSALKLAGFDFRKMENSPEGVGGFAGQLNPLSLGPRPINLHWKIKNRNLEPSTVPYFVKSDNDMDRPNVRGRKSKKLP